MKQIAAWVGIVLLAPAFLIPWVFVGLVILSPWISLAMWLWR